ncbi:MAG TPA: hypothetical protein VEA61_10170 [Allosphingosinicella sp.]|nr:hypothetical protein [Allosphingosinicella sp.]
MARLVREGPPRKKPMLGALEGKVKFDLEDGFFDPLPDEYLGLGGD